MQTAIFLPSHNKAQCVQRSIDSVLAQRQPLHLYLIDDRSGEETRRLLQPYASDPRVTYIERDDETPGRYRPGVIFNWLIAELLPLKKHTYFMFHADDDLLEPDCLDTLVGYLESTGAMAAYGWSRRLRVDEDGSEHEGPPIIGGGDFGPQGGSPDCAIDGQMVLLRMECLASIPYPWWSEAIEDSAHSDGLWLAKIANRFTIHQVPRYVMQKRLCVYSSHDQGRWIPRQTIKGH